ncbi:DUF7681 family protein [Tropicibacter sp. S64]|uniref:Acb2/Tad1 domain-containing protein n=1 Tax=Tropicibacter sp. S64 TaxID=3415122 RepID=UPI003C7B23B0
MADKAADFQEDVRRRLAGAIEALAIERGVTPEAMMATAAQVLSEAREVPSSSDAGTVNNSARQNYRVPNEMEKAQVDGVKELGDMFIDLCHEIGGTDPDGERAGSRNLSLAITHIEDAVMRAVRHITS